MNPTGSGPLHPAPAPVPALGPPNPGNGALAWGPNTLLGADLEPPDEIEVARPFQVKWSITVLPAFKPALISAQMRIGNPNTMQVTIFNAVELEPAHWAVGRHTATATVTFEHLGLDDHLFDGTDKLEIVATFRAEGQNSRPQIVAEQRMSVPTAKQNGRRKSPFSGLLNITPRRPELGWACCVPYPRLTTSRFRSHHDVNAMDSDSEDGLWNGKKNTK